VEDSGHNAQEVIRGVGLQSYAGRMAGELSGGNKRNLLLGIALMGNATVLFLYETSSGMDAASKGVMWRTLASVITSRSLFLTTQ
jgi:ATP-binding cassette, subfamily A (ABC1), member 3